MTSIEPITPDSAPGTTVRSVVDGRPAAAFVPAPLGEISVDTDAVRGELEAAERACQRLSRALAGDVPDRQRVVARQLSDAGLSGDTRRRYGAAVDRAMAALRSGSLTPDDVREIHAARVADGGDVPPGRFRVRQGFITDDVDDPDAYRLVVVPPHAVLPELRSLTGYVGRETGRNPLIDAALIHYHLLTVHPFPDGNGRTVRALTDALLREATAVDGPGLSLVPYIFRHKAEYHDALLTANRTGNFTPFLRLFLRGVREQSRRSRRAVTGGHSLLAALRATVAGWL